MSCFESKILKLNLFCGASKHIDQISIIGHSHSKGHSEINMKFDWGWAYDGVNSSIPRNTGPECVNYLSIKRHVLESLILVPLAIIILRYGLSRLPKLHINYERTQQIVLVRQILLITMTALLGLEMGFKLSTRTVIYILNPCHITSMLQVYLLAFKPSKWTTTLFRIHINYLNGPLLAFLFPEHDSRKITFELATYYVQHGLMLLIPIYLLRCGGPFMAEKLTDLSYSIAAYGIFLFYHFGFLEFFAVSAGVNLNHMICPAILDPFQGANYRLSACIHQALLCPIISKMLAYLFSSTSLNSNTIEIGGDLLKSEKILEPPVKINKGLMLKNVSDTSCVNLQKGGIPSEGYSIRNNVDDQTKTNNGKKNENFLDGRQIRNGYDIGNSLPGENLDLCMKGSDKKIQ